MQIRKLQLTRETLRTLADADARPIAAAAEGVERRVDVTPVFATALTAWTVREPECNETPIIIAAIAGALVSYGCGSKAGKLRDQCGDTSDCGKGLVCIYR